ncbi:MAG TPA: DUF2024 family protein [Flavobacteriaceae bacterium]|nr:DUF2024 family protein [Bacteroidota bacterium]HPF11188.1 DUF2024 family protein [Flavobacteriaceae bacterium]HQU22424.1 DUF2024 family protein [Flavobacteriaceae bacterium]HQU66325.1 DUF2024 family protein [Flavobacteriaceae bacterium]HRW43693.1 DUF2024 family protein [Flavobacteriaceae bacterium]
MQVAVWDTYVKRQDGKMMHFDILVPSEINDLSKVQAYGNIYLSTKAFETQSLMTSKCNFCHIQEASQEITQAIAEKGFAIFEMKNCD